MVTLSLESWRTGSLDHPISPSFLLLVLILSLVIDSAAESLAKAMLQAKVMGSSPLELNILLKRTATKSKHQSNGKLLTFRRQTDRLQSLFLQLKVFTIQYTEGRLSLTDLYKRNNDVLRRIARSSRGVYDSPRTELLKNSSESSVMTLSSLLLFPLFPPSLLPHLSVPLPQALSSLLTRL
jgi:hypothetical protein